MLSAEEEQAFREALDRAEADEIERQNRVIASAAVDTWHGSQAVRASPAARVINRALLSAAAVLALLACIGVFIITR